MKVGLQLYTVRDSYHNKEEFKELLLKIKNLGYEGVEFAGYSDFEADELKKYLSEIDLVAIASHHDINELEQRAKEILSFDYAIGCRYVVCSYAPTTDWVEVEHLLAVMEKAAEAAKDYNIEILYHNHTNELLPLDDGILPIQYIKRSCKLELDTYWAFHAGMEPCHYLKTWSNRISLVHIKDGDLEGKPCAIGEGVNNIKGIIETSKQIGIEWLIVENDDPNPDGLSDVKRSIGHLLAYDI